MHSDLLNVTFAGFLSRIFSRGGGGGGGRGEGVESAIMQISVVKLIFLLFLDKSSGEGKSL